MAGAACRYLSRGLSAKFKGSSTYRSTHLGLLVRPSGNNDPNGQENDCYDLQTCEPLAPQVAGGQRGDAPARPEYDMYRNGDVVAERMVVQHVDGEEEEDVDQPAAEGHAVRSEEEGRAVGVELGDVACDGHEDELNKGQEGPFEDVRTAIKDEAEFERGGFDRGVEAYRYLARRWRENCQHFSGRGGANIICQH